MEWSVSGGVGKSAKYQFGKVATTKISKIAISEITCDQDPRAAISSVTARPSGLEQQLARTSEAEQSRAAISSAGK